MQFFTAQSTSLDPLLAFLLSERTKTPVSTNPVSPPSEDSKKIELKLENAYLRGQLSIYQEQSKKMKKIQ